MQYLGNGQYQIKNSQTGQTKVVGENDLPNYGLSAPKTQPNILQQAGSALSWLNPFKTNTDILTQTPGQMAQFQSQQPSSKGNLGQSISNAAASTGELARRTIGNPNLWLEDTLNALAFRGAKGAAPIIASDAKLGANALRYPTKNALANATTNIADQATQTGAKGTWEELNKQFTQNVMKKYGMSSGSLPPAISDALNQIRATFTPAGIESIPSTLEHTPTQLLSNRRNILNAYGGGPSKIAQLISGVSASPEQKVASVMRGTLSDYLHELAPKTQALDKLYTLYSKGGKWGGSPVDLLKKYGIPAAAGAIGLPKVVGGLFGDYVGNH